MRYHNIEKYSTTNGDGLRTVLWTAYCPFKCKGCQNPQTWNKDGGVIFDKEAYSELLGTLDDRYVSGLTLSGGECLSEPNINTILDICKLVKTLHPNKTIWVYSGWTYEEILVDSTKKNVIELCDVLVDGKFEIDNIDISLNWRGSSNQRVIDVQQSLKQNKVILYCD